MNDQSDNHSNEPWGERLASESAAAGSDEPTLRRLLVDAVGVVKGRLGEVSRTGIRPLLDEAAAQVRPATPRSSMPATRACPTTRWPGG